MQRNKCKIKIIKLATAFWTRLSTNNEWFFSTNNEHQILTKCKQLSDRILRIKGSGILRLPAGCSAKSDDMRLTAHREITTSAETQTLENSYLEVTEILTKIDPVYTALIKKIIDDETPTADTSLPKNEATGPLRLGRDLHEIVERAKALGEYKKIYYQYSSLNSNFTWGGLAIIAIITCICIYIMGSVLGGPFKLIWSRMFSGNNQDTESITHTHWHGGRKQQALLPRHEQSTSTPELSTIQKLAASPEEVVFELQPKKTIHPTANYASII